MKVESKFTINDKIVEKVGEFAGLTVYQLDVDDDELILYFTKGETVVQKLCVSADCNQNFGFISNFYFTGVKS